MNQTQQLLAEYVAKGSEEAFRELVLLYVDLVYSTAVRLVNGDANLAEDICQVVFINLARKARTLSSNVKLGGWLHRDTCFTASKVRRAEWSRKRRELESMEMNEPDHQTEAKIAPVLDEAINALKEEDRTAILLRFFERLDFRSIGETLGSSEAAAQKRVSRALEKLQVLLKERGVMFSAAALTATLTTEAITKAPAALAATLPGTVLTAVSHSGQALILAKIMAMTKSKMAIISILVFASVVTSLFLQRQAIAGQRAQKESFQQSAEQIGQLAAENERLSNLADRSNRDRQFQELQKLRAEAERLKTEAQDLPVLREKEGKREPSQLQEAQTIFQIKET